MEKTAHQPAEYMRPAQAAKYLAIHPRTLRQWMQRRLFPFHRMSKRCVLIKRSDLDRMVAQFRVERNW